MPFESAQWANRRNPVLTQLAQVARVLQTVFSALHSLYLQEGILSDVVGVPESAHRSHSFQRRTGYFFVDRASASYGLCDTLLLPVQDSPATVLFVIIFHRTTTPSRPRLGPGTPTGARRSCWKNLFKEGVLDTHLKPFLHNSEKYYKQGRARDINLTLLYEKSCAQTA